MILNNDIVLYNKKMHVNRLKKKRVLRRGKGSREKNGLREMKVVLDKNKDGQNAPNVTMPPIRSEVRFNECGFGVYPCSNSKINIYAPIICRFFSS